MSTICSLYLQVQEAFGLAATPRLVACACSRGVVRVFSSKMLTFRANLPFWSRSGQEGLQGPEGAPVCGLPS